MLFSTDNAKAIKARKYGYLNAELYLAPAQSAGIVLKPGQKPVNMCPSASPGCIATCLNTAGMGIFTSTQASRIHKTNMLLADWPGFIEELRREVWQMRGRALREGLKLAVRPNGTSDLPKLASDLRLAINDPSIVVYDYTKNPKPWLRMTAGYHLTFSRSETNEADCHAALDHGVNVAVVFDTHKDGDLPKRFWGYKVIDGDTHDLRFLDPEGVIVGLRAKGFARQATPGFVVEAR